MSNSTLEIQQFAEKYRLRVQCDDCGEKIVRGRFGQIYSHGDGVFGLVLDAPAWHTRFDRALKARRRIALQESFQLHQRGDIEAILLFSPRDVKKAALAIKLVHAKRKRNSSPAQLKNLLRGPIERRVRRPEPADALALGPNSEQAENHRK